MARHPHNRHIYMKPRRGRGITNVLDGTPPNSWQAAGTPHILPNKHFCQDLLTEPRRTLQPKCTQWFPRIGLFVVQAISLGPCRRPIEFLPPRTPAGFCHKFPNSQIHNVEKWKFLSHFRRKDYFVISHEHKDRFFVVIWPKKTLGNIKYWPRIDPFFSKNQNFDPNIKCQRINGKNLADFIIVKFQNFDFF